MKVRLLSKLQAESIIEGLRERLADLIEDDETLSEDTILRELADTLASACTNSYDRYCSIKEELMK